MSASALLLGLDFLLLLGYGRGHLLIVEALQRRAKSNRRPVGSIMKPLRHGGIPSIASVTIGPDPEKREFRVKILFSICQL
jgi:hypothetical protein